MNKVAVLLGAQRCGTHFLGSCIGSHPDITYVDEITVPMSLKKIQERVRTIEDINDYISEFYSSVNTDWVLLDIKYRHIFKPLNTWIEEKKVIHIKRTDIKAVFYSMMYAEIRRSNRTGEYAEWVKNWDDKKRAKKPEGNAPTIQWKSDKYEALENWLKRNWNYYKNIGLEFEYNKLTDNKQTTKLPKWASKKICDFLGVEYHLLTTNLSKMSPSNFKEYIKCGC